MPRPMLLALLLSAATLPSAVAEDFAAPLSKLEVQDGDTIVFLGDSITHQALYTQYVEDYFYTRFPNLKIRFHNAGVGGARAWDALQRFDRDVASYKPRYVTVLLGMNDGSYRAFDQAVWETYRTDMTQLINEIREAGATPILMTPTMYDTRAALMRGRDVPPEGVGMYNAVLAYYGEWLREVALREGLGYVDLHGPLNALTMEQREEDPQFTLIGDAVHPDAPGQLVMAAAIIEQLDLPRQVSSIRIGKTPDGTPDAKVTGGKVSGLTVDDEGLTFTFRAGRLPWVVPEEAQQGAKLLKLGHRLGREALEIHDLPAGTYELTIDGEPVGTYNSTELARHIELQDNPRTPQYQQALEVATLNKQRNDGPVKKLRGAWGQFQQWARLKKQLDENPAAEQKVKDQFAQLDAAMRDLDERVRQAEAEAAEIEQRIREAARPQAHEYALRPVRSAEVTATVVLDGQPLPAGKVTFYGERGPIATGTVSEGSTIIQASAQAGVPPGEYRVAIEADGVPEKFARSESTPLTVTVQEGENNFSFELAK